MRLFRFWTREQCIKAITELEEGISLGAQSIQYTTGGGMAFTTLDNASQILKHLYRQVDDLDGKPSGRSAVKHQAMTFSRGL